MPETPAKETRASEVTRLTNAVTSDVSTGDLRGSTQPAGQVPLIFETGETGRANRYFPNGRSLEEFLPAHVLRGALPLPDNSELEVVRHFTKLSQRTFSIDTRRSTTPWRTCPVSETFTRLRPTSWRKVLWR